MLKTKIQQDIKEAMKAGNKEKLEVLRYLSAQIQNSEIEKGKKELADEEMVRLVSNQIKKLQESLVLFEKGQRQDLITKTKKEIAILSVYLPIQLSDEELIAEVKKIINANSKIVHPGALTGLCIKALAGRAENSRIVIAVQTCLK